MASATTAIPTFPATWKKAKPKLLRPRRLQVSAHVGTVDRRRRQRFPGIDTRIHWDNPEEGWIGGKTEAKDEGEKKEDVRQMLNNLLKNTHSYYELLGVSAQADSDEISSAYRRLSKECHPDTTTLPVAAAYDKFVHLQEAFNVLSDEASRRTYDDGLAKEVASRQAEAMKLRLEDPFEQDVRDWQSIPDMVDRLGGRNMKLSDQTLSAISIDLVAILVSICCMIYALLFKETI
ncbi:NAD(P)H-quinone oxidoreductase subunit T, chloroplastic-like [Nymphaea colorata]|nr:NAD(P)H-quinone oxidoreductase subunit T, chloroplastic-like [Nymphaea colorata]